MAPSIDASLVQPVDFRPKPDKVVHLEETPVIDFSILHSPQSGNLESVISQMRKSLQEWDFFVIENHGLAPELFDNVRNAMAKFSSLPYEEKKKASRDLKNPWGYNDKDHTKNTRDWAEVLDYVVNEGFQIPANMEPDCKETVALKNLWPPNPEEFQKVCEDYGRETTKLASKLLEILALCLGLPADRLNRYFEETMTYVRLNHYPPCPSPDLALGKGPHVDASAFTLLTTDGVSGFEVRRKSDGEWVRVRPTVNSFIFVPGDIFQVWTNEKYNSLLHRVVVNSQQERFSMITVFTPSYHTLVQPLEEMVDEQDPPKYRPYKWGEFFMTRRLSNFMKLEKPVIQITNFKIRE
ncbi:hypothetical protein AMTRI_Chr13g124630 [Amborella trichopoda]|nr:protein DMR6-LIKE OXYGENASE 2 [Amborella trichopoda]|eukprot:XP_006848567.2 protein DMR6-LIKE OXYGENASE 2 [Amborella trichopoda]